MLVCTAVIYTLRTAGEKKFDLQDRTLTFAKRVRSLVRQLPQTLANVEDAKQLLRSSGSVAANYAEADEALSTKDFLLRLRICRKEAKESRIHLQLLYIGEDAHLECERQALQAEARELLLIFSSIIHKNEM